MPASSIALAGTSAAAVSAGGSRTRVRAMAADHLVTARKLQRAEGPATILSLGTANPPTAREQSTYPDYYFRLTGSDHMLDLKHKFQRICSKTAIKKRYTILTDEILADNPELLTYMSHSLDARQRIAAVAIPEMAAAASIRAIDDWGCDSSSITHLLLCTTGLTGLPGADYQLHHLLGLRPSVQRLMLPLHGCHGGASVLRVAKDIAENNRGARVLAVCAETAAVAFRGPSEADPGVLVRMALFGDGAAAAVVGADLTPSERPIFRMVSAAQTVVAGSGGGIAGEVKEAGLVYELERGVPALIGANVERVVEEGLGVGEWNSAFWAVHPGGRAILDAVESELRLTEGKLAASRKVLEEYGNMASPTVFFILDEMRRRSAAEGLGTTGEGCERGMLLGFGPGLTIASLVLESVDLS